jgi:hypothetical protein
MQHFSDDYAARPEGLAERFNYPNVTPPVRVLGFRGELEKDGPYGTPVYTNVEYQVQLCPDPSDPVEIVWMSIPQWRELVGMTAS